MPEEELQVPAVCAGICIPMTGLQPEADESRWKGVGVMFTPTSRNTGENAGERRGRTHLGCESSQLTLCPPTRSQILAWMCAMTALTLASAAEQQGAQRGSKTCMEELKPENCKEGVGQSLLTLDLMMTSWIRH